MCVLNSIFSISLFLPAGKMISVFSARSLSSLYTPHCMRAHFSVSLRRFILSVTRMRRRASRLPRRRMYIHARNLSRYSADSTQLYTYARTTRVIYHRTLLSYVYILIIYWQQCEKNNTEMTESFRNFNLLENRGSEVSYCSDVPGIRTIASGIEMEADCKIKRDTTKWERDREIEKERERKRQRAAGANKTLAALCFHVESSYLFY